MIQKFFEKIFLAQKFLNGPIRKVIMLKVKFEDLQKIFPFTRSLTRHLEDTHPQSNLLNDGMSGF